MVHAPVMDLIVVRCDGMMSGMTVTRQCGYDNGMYRGATDTVSVRSVDGVGARYDGM